MADAMVAAGSEAVRPDEPFVVVSSDCHVSPDLEADLAPYCPSDRRRDFDDWLAETAPMRVAHQKNFVFGGDESDPKVMQMHTWNLQTDGHHDIHARIRDMDRDGVAGEVIFHGSAPFQPIPFLATYIGKAIDDGDLAAVGQRMYNAWLADFCSVEPERHIGLAHLPMWDIDSAIAELRWAAEHGLRGVNFPQSRMEITPYEDPAWEPFWSACEDLGMVLANHGGGGASTPPTTGPLSTEIYSVESNAFSRVSPLVRLVFGGVFERHPRLKLVQTEQVGDWYGRVLAELDSRWAKFAHTIGKALPKPPSEYCRSNYFVGASFQSRAEAEAAIRDGYEDNVMWGSDYPHPEGTFRYPADPDETPVTQLAMRNTYHDLPTASVRKMLGENAEGVYGFDRAALRAVANRINAPTPAVLAEPVEEIPGHWGLAFRETAFYR